ncbi:MAG: hypothetical protein AAGJ53_10580 [Pseudomonadota bacterium]
MPDGEQGSAFDVEPATEPRAEEALPASISDASTALTLPPVQRGLPQVSPVLEIVVSRNGEQITASRQTMWGFWIGMAAAACVGVALFFALSPA